MYAHPESARGTDRCRSSSLSDTTNFSEGSAASARRKRDPLGAAFVGLPVPGLLEDPASVSQRGESMALSLDGGGLGGLLKANFERREGDGDSVRAKANRLRVWPLPLGAP